MSKTRNRKPSQTGRQTPRRSGARRTTKERVLDVMSQLEIAVKRPRAAIFGAVLGGSVPWFARALAHGEVPDAIEHGKWAFAVPALVVVLGCCLFSVFTIFKFGMVAFNGDRFKAVGFVAALEGVMLVSQGTTSVVALLLLVALNAIANGCVIAVSRDATERRRLHDAQRSATRAQNRAQNRGAQGSPPISTPAPTAWTVPSPAPACPAWTSPASVSPRRRVPRVVDVAAGAERRLLS
jgi:hypothetical protein